MTRTGWYRGDQYPVRSGLFERDYSPRADQSCISMDLWKRGSREGLCFGQPGTWFRWRPGYSVREENGSCVYLPARWVITTQGYLPWRGVLNEGDGDE